KKSCGIFHDFYVHDIDLAWWFLGGEIQTVWSIGGAYKYPAFGEAGDADSVITTCQFDNGTMAVINACRTAMHGHDTYTEVVGTLGTLLIGRPAQLNRVEIYDQYGVRKECVETFWDRFQEGFLTMAEDFIDCVLTGRKPELTLADARQATIAAEAFTTSFETASLVRI
ncbi:MAG: Gfo/Idh/MocA family oxidoreductase, partial [Bacteroidota bacterium]